MENDTKGRSTCKKGQENYEYFRSMGRKYVQYDYRTYGGKLFSCIANDLKTAREKRDKWLDSFY
jgi:hypothetical protein